MATELAEAVHGTLATGVKALQAAMVQMPQVELPTEHYFADGMYCRMVRQFAGVVVVGKVHKKEHFFMVVRGSVAVVQDGAEERIYHAPAVIVSRPGTQRALAAVEDCTYLTVHRTEETDLDAVEADLVEPDPTSPFGVGNKLKSLEHQSWPS